MKTKIYEKATEYIESLASSLGVAAEHVYGILVKQQVAEGIAYSVTTLVAIVILAFATRFFTKKTNESHNEGYFVGLILSAITLAVVAIIGIIELPTSIMKIVNPEYYAIQEIMEVIKGAND